MDNNIKTTNAPSEVEKKIEAIEKAYEEFHAKIAELKNEFAKKIEEIIKGIEKRKIEEIKKGL